MKKKRQKEKPDKQETKQEESKPIAADVPNKGKKALVKNIVCMTLILVSTAAAALAGSLFTRQDLYYTVRNLTLCLSAALTAVFSFQAGRISKSFFYDDGEYPERFLYLYLCGILCAIFFIKLPVTGWMFLFFFVALSRVSDSVTGICAGGSLLVLTIVLCEQVSLSTFLAYFLSGMIGIALFAHQKDEFYTAIPLGLALGSQLLLIFAGELLIQNKKLVLEQTLVSLANTVMNGILICIFLQYYINKVAKKKDNLYLQLSDPEYPLMAKMREENKEEYYCALHTAYLVERITTDLQLDVRSAKCAAYYGHLPQETLSKIEFPDSVQELLNELNAGEAAICKKEAVIVRICYEVIRLIQYVKKQDSVKKPNYDSLINQMFEKRFTKESMRGTEITLPNLEYIQKRLLDEKMYYELFMT